MSARRQRPGEPVQAEPERPPPCRALAPTIRTPREINRSSGIHCRRRYRTAASSAAFSQPDREEASAMPTSSSDVANREIDVQRHVGGDRRQGHVERRAGIFPGEEAGRQRLDQHERRKPDGEGRQGARGSQRILGQEPAAFEQDADDRIGQQPQRHGSRQAEQQAELEGAILVGHGRLRVAGAQLAGEQRQQCRADGDADDAQPAAGRCGRHSRARRSCPRGAARPRRRPARR